MYILTNELPISDVYPKGLILKGTNSNPKKSPFLDLDIIITSTLYKNVIRYPGDLIKSALYIYSFAYISTYRHVCIHTCVCSSVHVALRGLPLCDIYIYLKLATIHIWVVCFGVWHGALGGKHNRSLYFAGQLYMAYMNRNI